MGFYREEIVDIIKEARMVGARNLLSIDGVVDEVLRRDIGLEADTDGDRPLA